MCHFKCLLYCCNSEFVFKTFFACLIMLLYTLDMSKIDRNKFVWFQFRYTNLDIIKWGPESVLLPSALHVVFCTVYKKFILNLYNFRYFFL